MIGAIKMKLLKSCCGCICIFFGGIIILFLGLYVYDKWIWEEWPIERIEQVSGIRVPSYNIIETYKGKRYFTGDHHDLYIIEFKTVPSDELFDEIDKMIAAGNTNWVKEGNKYTFSIVWGNGLPTPKGESDNYDGTFGITITKGERNGEISSGSW